MPEPVLRPAKPDRRDAQGRRKSKTVGSTTTDYVTDADNREVLEYDGTSGALERWYAFGQGPDAVLGQMNVAAGTRETMIPDIQGSIIGTLDSGTGVLAKSGYQPFGENPAVTTGTYRYAARRFDPETAGSTAQPSGLYYYRARTYSPTWGRFLQPDPIGYAAGPNLYAYVNNDPLNLTDPSGLFGFVINYGGQSEVGLPLIGQAGAQVSQNIAFLVDTSHLTWSNPLNINVSVVSYQSHGGIASIGLPSVPQGSINAPLAGIASSGGGVIVGAFAGQGVSVGITNANTAADFAPPSATESANVGLLGTNLGGQISSTASGTVTITGSIPGLGSGAGIGASIYQTQSNVQTLFTTSPK